MEYCGGGSLQDIYHGTLKLILPFVPFRNFVQRRNINKNRERLVQAGHRTWLFGWCHVQEQVIGSFVSYSCSCAILGRSFVIIFPSEVSSGVVDCVERFIGVVGRAIWGLALPSNGNNLEFWDTRALSALFFSQSVHITFKQYKVS